LILEFPGLASGSLLGLKAFIQVRIAGPTGLISSQKYHVTPEISNRAAKAIYLFL
jgi:hypothetical protein